MMKNLNKSPLLEIKELSLSVKDACIIKNLSLRINPGEVHVIMGPNGSGKSTLANVLARKEGYIYQQGSISYLGEDLLKLSPEVAACRGLFLGFQYPVSIPGVSNIHFLKTALNAIRQSQGLKPLDAIDFLSLVKERQSFLDMPEELLYRPLNDGFSGGEKKRNEILQMSLLSPTLSILDEIDSGLDIDALKAVAKGINHLRHPDRSILIITHYHRFLEYVIPDFIHVMSEGTIVHSGDKSLGLTIENKGYGWLTQEETV